MTQPNFFLVGAPKCGTTAMNVYLGQHPEVFMCPVKEAHHFAPDIPNRNLRYESLEKYLELFAGVTDQPVVGEGAVYYLYSRLAAAGIHRFNPEAKILVMLRNPVEWVASYHAQLVLNAEENLPLEEALLAQEERRSRRRLPPRVEQPALLLYDEVCSFSEQVVPYLDAFGRERVKVLLLDDLQADAGRAYQSVLQFLGVDDGFRPKLAVVNANKVALSTAFARFVERPPRPLESAVRAVLPWGVATRVRRMLKRLNRRPRLRPPMAAALRQSLTERYRGEIERLGTLLDRDLSAWLDTSEPPTPTP